MGHRLTFLDQSGPESYDNEEALVIRQSSKK